MTDAGQQAVLVSAKAGEVQTSNHLDKAEKRPVDETVAHPACTAQSRHEVGRGPDGGLARSSPKIC